MNNISKGSCVSRAGGGGGERCSINQKPPLIKKVYHKVNKYLFDYCKRANIRGGFNFTMFAVDDFSAKLKQPRSFYNTSVFSYLVLHVRSYIIRDRTAPAY